MDDCRFDPGTQTNKTFILVSITVTLSHDQQTNGKEYLRPSIAPVHSKTTRGEEKKVGFHIRSDTKGEQKNDGQTYLIFGRENMLKDTKCQRKGE